jgi:hypothetical protein
MSSRTPVPLRDAALRRFTISVSAMLLGGASAALASACGDSAGGATFADPCTTVYAEKCGAPCTADEACSAGLYCGANSTCTADCVPGGAQCNAGTHCGASGLCVSDEATGSGGGFATSAASMNGTASGCPDIVVTFEKVIPTVVLLIDQSGSMTQAFGNGDRWNVLHDALMDPTTGIVKSLEDEVRFGLALYTSNDGNAGGTCPILSEVGIAIGNYDEIESVYGPAGPEGETPTGESIEAVTATLAAMRADGPKVIVLATDGEPDTCAEPNPQNGQEEAIAAAEAAFGQGIPTYIVSVGSDVSVGHMQDMANAGAGKPVGGADNATYYQALDPAALIAAFDEIINGVRSCVFTLNGSVSAENASQGTVVLDGEVLGYDDPDGWKLNNPGEIELTGAACDLIQEGNHELSVTFPCGTVDPPE